MQSSAVRKSAHAFPPLEEESAPLDGSTTSTPEIATLLERFDEPLRDAAPSTAAQPAIAASGQYVPNPQREGNVVPQSPEPVPAVAPVPTKRSGLPRNALIVVLALVALVPLGILFAQLWPDMMRPQADGGLQPAGTPSAAETHGTAGLASPKQGTSPLEVALSSPPTITANVGQEIRFPIAIDATAPLPARSIVVITALPAGASFSQGHPYGDNGWSLRPDEIGLLRLRLPAQSGASDVHLELVAGDGTVLSQSETRLSIAPAQVATTDDPLSAHFAPSEQIATAEVTGSVTDTLSAPSRRPSSTAESESSPKVNTVKVVTIKPPRDARPHDGGYGLGPATEEAQAPDEWMETKTAVDMHARAEQKSETVKIAQGGIKVRVTRRDKNWIQVHDPKNSTTGWIYNRFLKPTDPPAE